MTALAKISFKKRLPFIALVLILPVFFSLKVLSVEIPSQYNNQILKVDVKKNPGKNVDLIIYTAQDGVHYKHNVVTSGTTSIHTFDFDKTLNAVNSMIDTASAKNIVQSVKVKQLMDTTSQSTNDFARIIVTVNDQETKINPVINPLKKSATKITKPDSSKMKILEIQDSAAISKSFVEVEKPIPIETNDFGYSNNPQESSNHLALSRPIEFYTQNNQFDSPHLSYPHYNHPKTRFDTVNPKDITILDLPEKEIGELATMEPVENLENLENGNIYLAQNQPTDSISSSSLEQPQPERKLKTNFIISTDLDQNTLMTTVIIVFIVSGFLMICVYFLKKYISTKYLEPSFPKPIPKATYNKYTAKVEHYLHEQQDMDHETGFLPSPQLPLAGNAQQHINQEHDENVMNIDVIDAVTIEEGKDIFFVEYEKVYKLVGYENDDVYVITNLPHFKTKPEELHVTFAGLAAGIRMYEVKVGSWHGVICHKKGVFVLHTVIKKLG